MNLSNILDMSSGRLNHIDKKQNGLISLQNSEITNHLQHQSPQNSNVPTIRGLVDHHTPALMSPATNTNRKNLLNDTRGSVQSSVIKNDGRHHQLNSSFGGVSGMSIGVNGQSNGGMNMRIMSNGSFDYKMANPSGHSMNNS